MRVTGALSTMFSFMLHHAGMARITPLSLILIHLVGLPAEGALVIVPAPAPAPLVSAELVAIRAPVPTEGATVRVSPAVGTEMDTAPVAAMTK